MNPKKVKKGSTTPILDNFSRDLIKLAEEGKIDPIVGRDKEVKRIAQIVEDVYFYIALYQDIQAIIKWILSIKKVDTTTGLRWATERGHTNIVNFLKNF